MMRKIENIMEQWAKSGHEIALASRIKETPKAFYTYIKRKWVAWVFVRTHM